MSRCFWVSFIDFIEMIEDDAVVREADQLDLLEEENEVLLAPDQ